MRYASDVAALARKDLLLELRARETVPSMLVFVLAALVVFHFALPAGSSDLAAKGLLWVAIVFTALLGLTRAFVAEREQGLFDGLVLAPVDRSAIWLAKAIAVLAFLVVVEVFALPAYGIFFAGLDGRTDRRGRTRGRRDRGRRDAALGDGRRGPGARAPAAAALPPARDPGDRGRRGRERGRRRPLSGLPRGLRRCFRDTCLGLF